MHLGEHKAPTVFGPSRYHALRRLRDLAGSQFHVVQVVFQDGNLEKKRAVERATRESAMNILTELDLEAVKLAIESIDSQQRIQRDRVLNVIPHTGAINLQDDVQSPHWTTE